MGIQTKARTYLLCVYIVYITVVPCFLPRGFVRYSCSPFSLFLCVCVCVCVRVGAAGSDRVRRLGVVGVISALVHPAHSLHAPVHDPRALNYTVKLKRRRFQPRPCFAVNGNTLLH